MIRAHHWLCAAFRHRLQPFVGRHVASAHQRAVQYRERPAALVALAGADACRGAVQLAALLS